MNENETRLFKDYKKLDILLKKKFNSYDGVSEYIDRMNTYNKEGSLIIDNWTETLKRLITVRYKRNAISHDDKKTGTIPADIQFIHDFEQLVLEKRDPLYLFYVQKGYIKRAGTNQVNFNELSDNSKKRKSKLWVLIVVAVLLVLGILLAKQKGVI